jgi:DNA-binding MarR family transcriptional regulator
VVPATDRRQLAVDLAAADESPLRSLLGFLLKRAHNDHQAIQAPALESHEIDGRFLAVLTVVSELGPAPQQRLVELLNVDRTTMVALVDKLEQKGLVSRNPDPHDRRAYLISITRRGKQIRRRAQAAADDAEREFLRNLSEAERQQFLSLLQKLTADRPQTHPSR